MRYLRRAAGLSTAILIIKMEYPTATWATVSLLVADRGEPAWVHRNELFYADPTTDENAQPAGQVDFYLSDFLSRQETPASELCRPTDAEAAAGIVRYVFSIQGLLLFLFLFLLPFRH